MCLAVPGKIVTVSRTGDDPVLGSVATVDFQGSRLDVSLAMTPEADVGDWVLVHAGFAMTVLDEADAMETWEYLNMVAEADDSPGPAAPTPPAREDAD